MTIYNYLQSSSSHDNPAFSAEGADPAEQKTNGTAGKNAPVAKKSSTASSDSSSVVGGHGEVTYYFNNFVFLYCF